MKRIIIVTGDNVHQIYNAKVKIKSDYTLIDYPEAEGFHPKKMAQKIRNLINKNKNEIYLITTFNIDILNLIGFMIEEKEIGYEEAEVFVATNGDIIHSTYCEEGYLMDYPIDFLSWMPDEE